MKSIKEKRLLVKWAKAMNEPIDPLLVEEVERYDRTLGDVIESIKQNSLNDLVIAAKQPGVIAEERTQNIRVEYPKPPTVEEVISHVQPAKTIVEKTADHITKEVKIEENSFQQPDPPQVDRDLKDVVKKIKFLEQWLSKISTAGPGGGEVNLAFMEMAVKSVTSSSYTAVARDYYIGVNYEGAVSVTLPSNPRQGKVVVVKDERGEASLGTNRYITIWPAGSDRIDNRSHAILAYDYGSLTFVFKNGNWRII